MENENIKVVKENENETDNNEVKEEQPTSNNTNTTPNQVIHSINIEVAKGGWYHDIFVAKNFKINRDDGEVIDFKADIIEDGLIIPMFKSDNTPYYQLIDFETLNYIIELFFKPRVFKDKMMIVPPLPIK